MFLLLFLVLVSIGGASRPCESFKKDDPIEFDAAVECLGTLDYKEDVKVETLNYVKSLLSMYVYRDIVSDNGDPWNQKIDIMKNLEEFEGSFRTDYEFHAALRNEIAQLKDPHTAYMPPTCYGFRFYQPFPIRQLKDGTFEITNFWDPADIALNIPDKYEKVYRDKTELINNVYEGSPILKIEGQDPQEVITKFARDECSYSRDEMVRYNYVLRSEWHKRSTLRNKVPERSIEYTIFFNNTEIKIDVPWVAVAMNNYKFENMESICGYEPPEEQERRRMITNSVEEESYEKKNTFPNFFYLNSPFLTSSIIPSRHSIIQKILRDSLHVHEIDRQIDLLSSKSNLDGRRELEETSSSTTTTTTTTADPKGYDKISLSFRSYEYYRLFYNNKTKVAVLKVLTFMPDMSIIGPTTQESLIETLTSFQAYFAQVYSAFSKMSRLGAEKLVVDVRGNVGGVGCLAFVLLRYLSPYSPIDPSPNADLIYTKLGDELHCGYNIIDRVTFFGQDRKPVTAGWYSSGNPRKRGAAGKTSQYSTLVHFGCEMQMIILGADRRWEDSPKMFEPEDITILTDGTCGSTCGVFVKLVQYLQLGRIVSQGGIYSSPLEDRENMNVASFPGGAVTTGSALVDQISIYSTVCPVSEENRIVRPNTKAMVTFAFLELYAWKPPISAYELERVDATVPMGQTRKPADFHISSWDFGGEILGSEELIGLFDVCAGWMIQRNDEACLPKVKDPIENGVYGFPCVNGSFYGGSGECKLRGCDRGYYLSYDRNECLVMPEEYDLISMAVKILLAGFFVAATILGFYLCYFCYICSMIMLVCIACVVAFFRLKGRRKKKRSGGENGRRNDLAVGENEEEKNMGEYARLPVEEEVDIDGVEMEMEMINTMEGDTSMLTDDNQDGGIIN